MSKSDTPIGDGQLIKPRMKKDGGYHMTCCDCSLVHRLDFTLNLNDEEIDLDKVRLELRVYRDEEKTAEARAAAPYDLRALTGRDEQ